MEGGGDKRHGLPNKPTTLEKKGRDKRRGADEMAPERGGGKTDEVLNSDGQEHKIFFGGVRLRSERGPSKDKVQSRKARET